MAPLASETTEDAESSLTEQAVIQTRNISAALPTATVEGLGNIAPVTRVLTTDLQEVYLYFPDCNISSFDNVRRLQQWWCSIHQWQSQV